MSIHQIGRETVLKDANLKRSSELYEPKQFSPIKHDVLKRAFDIFFSTFALILTFPVMLIICLLIRCTSKGPIFYRSLRMGREGKLIKCWKFRTMFVNAEKMLEEILKNDEALRHEWEVYFKLKNDPRVTPIGKWLRKTSLDEFPQFWNVLKGDLSIVGPRPYLVSEIQQNVGKRAEIILSVRPGLTGLWQTSGRSKLTFEERMKLEEAYIEKQSFLFDLRLILKTIRLILFPKGAY